MSSSKHVSPAPRGSVLVDVILLMPLFLGLSFGTLEIARGVLIRQRQVNLAREITLYVGRSCYTAKTENAAHSCLTEALSIATSSLERTEPAARVTVTSSMVVNGGPQQIAAAAYPSMDAVLSTSRIASIQAEPLLHEGGEPTITVELIVPWEASFDIFQPFGGMLYEVTQF